MIWLLRSLVPVRQLVLIALLVVGLQLLGVDLVGMVIDELANLLDPTGWFDLGGLW